MNANILNDADFAAAFEKVDNPQDFVRRDGRYDVSPLNLAPRDVVDRARDYIKTRDRNAPARRNPAGGIGQAVPGSDDLEEIA